MPFATETVCFRGDSEGLVDRLIAACELPQWTGPQMPGYGRELQPWCPDEPSSMAFEALEASSRHHPFKHGRSPDKTTSGFAVAKRSRASSPPMRRCSLDAGQGGFACPSFAAAPKPEALPMPTSSLMTRALARSPSPPKMMPAPTAVMA